MATCPICKKPVKPRSDEPAFPFCSARCKSIDLGNWLDERYRVPEGDAPEDDGSPSRGDVRN